YVGRSEEYGRQKRAEYTEVDYHAPSDQIKPDWDFSGAVEDAQLFFAVGYRVANADMIPEWSEGNEFKAKRDQTLNTR
nr:peptidase M28 [Acidobacteriota bacterium]